MAANAGVVNIRGKEYHTVAGRIQTFRDDHPEYTIETQLISADDERVVMKALIMNGEYLIATGYAEEIRDSSNINKTSALENCETSAVGRALAFFGLAGTEIASADEVANAIGQQKEMEAVNRLKAHNEAWRRNEESIHSIKEHLANDRLAAAWEELNEIDENDRMALRVAPTKGGCFTVEENKQLAEAKNQDFDAEAGVYRSIADKANK